MTLTKNQTDGGFVTLLTPNFYNLMYQDVREFRKSFLLPCEEGGAITSQDFHLHLALVQEELFETFTFPKRIDKLDGIIDTAYVFMGYCVHKGYRTMKDLRENDAGTFMMLNVLMAYAEEINADFLAAWDVVHSSNMSKRCASEAQLQETIEYYTGLQVPCESYRLDPIFVAEAYPDLDEDEVPALYIVTCKEDCTDTFGKPIKRGKILKSVGYTAVDLSLF